MPFFEFWGVAKTLADVAKNTGRLADWYFKNTSTNKIRKIYKKHSLIAYYCYC